MLLEPGCELGYYRILAPLGAGGMGKVLRCRDTRLGRDVAIKILPDELAEDSERRHRFELEAKIISRLNHPNICTLYDVGSQDGFYYLVMECIEGRTLENRLERGAMPLDQVLKYGIQLSEALDLAHRNGVVHRDVKPGNIMLTATGAKLLDFGIAKPETEVVNHSAITQPGESQPNTTQKGQVLGTFPYMSPEQVEGNRLDGRSDLFSLGAVLYEMVTGRRAFQGRSQLSVVSAILEKEPEPITLVKPLAPAALDHTIRRCLAKDPDERWQTGRDLAEELKWIQTSPSEAGTAAPKRASGKWRWLTLATLLAVLLLSSMATYWAIRPQPKARVVSALISPKNSKGFQFSGEGFGAPALSPDGRTVAFTAVSEDGKRRLWIRSLSGTTSQELTATDGASLPFWSPDSRNIGFFADNRLKRVATQGGTPQVLCNAGIGRGGAWNANGSIVFSPDVNSPLYKVPDVGGTPAPVTKLVGEETDHVWPYFLPDGEHFLFGVIVPGYGYTRVWVGSLRDDSRKPLIETDWNAVFASPGYLLYTSNTVLMARALDVTRLEFKGTAVPVGYDVDANSTIGQMTLSVSNAGDLLYRSAARQPTMEWRDHNGNGLGELPDGGAFFAPRISPDGRLLAVSQAVAGKSDVYLLDLSRRGARTRFTSRAGDNLRPVWYPDGKRIAFASNTGGKNQIFSKNVSGMLTEQPLLQDDYDDSPSSISSDGRFLAYMRRGSSSGKLETWVLPLAENADPAQFHPLPVGNKGEPMFSPDGQWLAYSSDESGRREIYIAPLPATNEKWQVSTEGGQAPAWSPDGKELFFLSMRDEMMSATIRLGLPPTVGFPRRLFFAPFNVAPPGVNYVVSPDGKRFLIMMLPQNPEDLPLTLVQNWTAGVIHY